MTGKALIVVRRLGIEHVVGTGGLIAGDVALISPRAGLNEHDAVEVTAIAAGRPAQVVAGMVHISDDPDAAWVVAVELDPPLDDLLVDELPATIDPETDEEALRVVKAYLDRRRGDAADPDEPVGDCQVPTWMCRVVRWLCGR